MTIYSYGCNCGSTGALIRRVTTQAKAEDKSVEIRNSKYSEEARIEHDAYLVSVGMRTDRREAIVVEGDKVVPLKLWS
jgi:hypothetical protein